MTRAASRQLCHFSMSNQMENSTKQNLLSTMSYHKERSAKTMASHDHFCICNSSISNQEQKIHSSMHIKKKKFEKHQINGYIEKVNKGV